MERLIQLGHRRIAAVVPSCSDRSVSELRYNGYRAALKEHGVEFDPALLAETGGCFEMPATYRGMCGIIERGADFSAVFTISDTMAIAAIKALEDNGRRVPEDWSRNRDRRPSCFGVHHSHPDDHGPASRGNGHGKCEHIIEDAGGRARRHLLLEARIREGASIKQV